MMVFLCRLALIPLFLEVRAATEESCLLQRGGQEKMQAAGTLEDATGENGTLALQNSYMFDLKLRAGDGVTITGDAFKGGDDSIFGCGIDDVKCKCLYPPEGFRMQGFGTDLALTGLEFWCRNIKFSMPEHDPAECTCNFKAMINFWGRGRDFIMECSPKQCYQLVDQDGQHPGTVHDLQDRFINPAGGGKTGATSWEFNLQADALGEAKAVEPDYVLGGWTPISAGASTSIKQSTTWSSTSTKATVNEVSASFTESIKYSYSVEGGVDVPAVAEAKMKSGLEVSLSSTQGWKNAVTDTFSKTEGGSKEFTCTPQPCPSGTSYQWQTAVQNHRGKWGALFDSCIFVCMPNQGQRPKCPYGACCSSDVADQCSKCSVEWCDKSDPRCPFHEESFTVGCDR